MKYLLILNRFDLDLDVLKKKLKARSLEKYVKQRVVIDSDLGLNRILGLHEVNECYQLYCDWIRFSSFKDLSLNALKGYKGSKRYKVVVKFIEKCRFSSKEASKRINSYFKKEGYVFSDEGDVLYVEFKKGYYRIGYSKNVIMSNVIKQDLSRFVVVLEKPSNVLEICDMFRLCWVFNVALVLLHPDEHALKLAKKETKGIDWNSFRLLKAIPNGFVKIGFSKHCSKNENDLVKVLKSKKKIALVFGNDKYGLTQGLRDKLDDCFRLTPCLRKPLRGSHALTYILGINFNVCLVF